LIQGTGSAWSSENLEPPFIGIVEQPGTGNLEMNLRLGTCLPWSVCLVTISWKSDGSIKASLEIRHSPRMTEKRENTDPLLWSLNKNAN
jgi:hypothetical protein